MKRRARQQPAEQAMPEAPPQGRACFSDGLCYNNRPPHPKTGIPL
ncbi:MULTISPECIES: hypothetical protein [unclassified Neisseria]|nr:MULTISPECIES: hypothetical protein [unclassified Neisseria]